MDIELRKMTAVEFEAYRSAAMANYASEKMKAEGHTPAEAERIAAEAFKGLGVDSPDQYLFSVVTRDGGQVVGTLWFAKRGTPEHPRAWLCDIVLAPEFQGKGYGEQTMRLLEARVRELGIRDIGLHVFAHNQRARALYEKLGYLATNVVMAKSL